MDRILVVDNEPEIVRFLAEVLRRRGYAVDTALTGEEALELMKTSRPRLVLLDIWMSGMDGLATLREIKKLDPAISVIMITAVRDREVVEEALKIGAYDYVMKPFEFEALSKMILGAFDASAG